MESRGVIPGVINVKESTVKMELEIWDLCLQREEPLYLDNRNTVLYVLLLGSWGGLWDWYLSHTHPFPDMEIEE